MLDSLLMALFITVGLGAATWVGIYSIAYINHNFSDRWKGYFWTTLFCLGVWMFVWLFVIMITGIIQEETERKSREENTKTSIVQRL